MGRGCGTLIREESGLSHICVRSLSELDIEQSRLYGKPAALSSDEAPRRLGIIRKRTRGAFPDTFLTEGTWFADTPAP
jgi:hypothetical protein